MLTPTSPTDIQATAHWCFPATCRVAANVSVVCCGALSKHLTDFCNILHEPVSVQSASWGTDGGKAGCPPQISAGARLLLSSAQPLQALPAPGVSPNADKETKVQSSHRQALGRVITQQVPVLPGGTTTVEPKHPSSKV